MLRNRIENRFGIQKLHCYATRVGQGKCTLGNVILSLFLNPLSQGGRDCIPIMKSGYAGEGIGAK